MCPVGHIVTSLYPWINVNHEPVPVLAISFRGLVLSADIAMYCDYGGVGCLEDRDKQTRSTLERLWAT